MLSTRRVSLFGFLGCSLWGLGLPVSAAQAAEVMATGPAECPDSAELGFRVARNLGVPLPQAPAVRFVVDMQRANGAYAARLRVLAERASDDKQRQLNAPDCSELADVVVVAMTLALGAAAGPAAPAALRLSTAAPPLTPPAEASPAPPQMPSAEVPPDEPANDEAAGSPLRPALSVAALADVGSLPGPALGAAVGFELGWRRLQLRALATLLFEQHEQVAGGPAGAELQLASGSLSGCSTALAGGRGLTLPVCLGLELGRLSGTGTGVIQPRSGSALWAAPRADVGALWCLDGGPLCLAGTLTAAAPLARSRFALAEIGTVYRPPAMVGRLSIGLVVGFD